MKRALLAIVVITMAMGTSGCLHHNMARNGGGRCGCRQCNQCCPNNAYGANGAGGGGAMMNGQGGAYAANGAGGGGAMYGQGGAYAANDPNGAYGGGSYGVGGANGGCKTCGRGLDGRPGGICNYDPSVHSSDGGQPGPAAAQVAYPYYTTRGPRDFLMNNPGSIGR